MAVCPLRPATDRRLGEPLPHHLANRPRAPLSASFAFPLAGLCGISSGFPELFPTQRQITHVLLTRPPLYSLPEGNFLVRLACVKRAASVDSEPGSNSRLNLRLPKPLLCSRGSESNRLESSQLFTQILT